MDTTPEPAGYGHAATLAPLARETIAAMTPADYLAALGRTADEVAATLAALGVTGIPMDPGACPLAVYLRKHTDMGRVMVFAGVVNRDGGFLVKTPDPVSLFIARFDAGVYPELVTPAGVRYSDL